jgi:hypothetical protein
MGCQHMRRQQLAGLASQAASARLACACRAQVVADGWPGASAWVASWLGVSHPVGCAPWTGASGAYDQEVQWPAAGCGPDLVALPADSAAGGCLQRSYEWERRLASLVRRLLAQRVHAMASAAHGVEVP